MLNILGCTDIITVVYNDFFRDSNVMFSRDHKVKHFNEYFYAIIRYWLLHDVNSPVSVLVDTVYFSIINNEDHAFF